MSAGEVFDALAFLRACYTVIGWDDTVRLLLVCQAAEMPACHTCA